MSRFFGQLRISPGEVAFTPRGWGNSMNLEPVTPLVHTDRALTIVFGRVLLPWMNSGLVLVDSAGSPHKVGRVLLTSGQRRAVVSAATTAGFDATVYPTWISAGGGIGSVTELARFRREHENAEH
jgi:hypothetical protein